MRGRRIFVDANGSLKLEQEGDYGQDAHGIWWCWVPRAAQIMTMVAWKVHENKDKTITVFPSIQVGSWRGWLENGLWREC